MLALKIIFWFFLFIIFYAYFGYGMLLYLLILIKRKIKHSSKNKKNPSNFPEVTLMVASYNEKDFIKEKIKNSMELDYPKDKLKQIWITDGTSDGSNKILENIEGVEVHHRDERAGKINAINRGMKFVKTSIVIFSDANAILGKESVKRIVSLFENPKTGCVSGEKRIHQNEKNAASGAGEGFYWKYESKLKEWDAELYSVVGAAGELFAIRTKLWQDVEPDTLLDDFIISLRIAMKGYTTQYDPEAYAIENSSSDIKEEMKRKVRISAGGIQSVIRLRKLLNIFKYGVLSFQYISHRVLRWAVTPFLITLMIPLNIILLLNDSTWGIYSLFFYAQILFYFLVFIGRLLRSKKTRYNIFYVPYYIYLMNISVFLGINRLFKGRQTVLWEKAKRGTND